MPTLSCSLSLFKRDLGPSCLLSHRIQRLGIINYLLSFLTNTMQSGSRKVMRNYSREGHRCSGIEACQLFLNQFRWIRLEPVMAQSECRYSSDTNHLAFTRPLEHMDFSKGSIVVEFQVSHFNPCPELTHSGRVGPISLLFQYTRRCCLLGTQYCQAALIRLNLFRPRMPQHDT